MKIIDKLAIKNLKLNKKRTLGTIIGIILSIALITAVAGMFTSLRATLIANATEETGYYHYSMEGLDEETLKIVEANRQVESIMKNYYLGIAKIEINDLKNTFMTVRSSDHFDDFPYVILKGRKPENAHEIVVPEMFLKETNLSIGDTIELDLGVRMTNDGFELDLSNPANPEETGEYIANSVHKTYKITGIYKSPGNRIYYSNNGNPTTFYAGITVGDESKSIDTYVILKDLHKRETFVNSLYATGKFRSPDNYDPNIYAVHSNNELLRWEVFAFSDQTIQMLYTLFGTVIAIILFTSIFCIRNSFAISTTEKSKMLGMLASIGATKSQIKKSVLKEAFVQGLIGIPLGIASGTLATFVLVEVVNLILKDAVLSFGSHLVFSISIPVCILAIALGILTIYFSAISSAIKASRISPIDNIRNAKDVTLTAKNMKTPKIINRVFKTGGTIAFKNLRRSKKKYRTTVISLTVSIFVFISMNTFLHETFGLTNKYYGELEYDLILSGTEQFTNDDIEKVKNSSDVDDIHVLYDLNNYVAIADLNKIDDAESTSLQCDKYDETTGTCIGKYFMSLYLIALDDDTFQEYVSKLGLDYESIKKKGILSDMVDMLDSKGNFYQKRRYNYEKGQKIEGTLANAPFELEIGAVTDVKPYGLEKYHFWGGFLIVDKDYFEELAFKPFRIPINTSKPDKLETEFAKNFKGIHIENIARSNRENRAMNIIVSIFMYGFIAVISLIGVTTIFNTITSNMELRSKEFAMLKSIGMTKKEFSHMINLETLFYSLKSLLWGISLGLATSYLIYKIFSAKNKVAYTLPLEAVIISTIFVFILVFIIMHFSISKIDKQNTIETIRKENI